jgi:hypothetical protein
MVIKSQAVMARLKEIEKVFSFGIDELFEIRFNFIFKILRIREVEEVEENIALNTLERSSMKR